jgi:hypothetical protein
MAELKQHLAEAVAALATLEELAGRNDLSVAERDGAILRLVYTFEAIWKAAALLLEQSERIEVGSPGSAIRACRQVGWLSDSDAEAAQTLAVERNLTVHMYRLSIGETIASHLPAHAVLLHRWLDALQQRAAAAEVGK